MIMKTFRNCSSFFFPKVLLVSMLFVFFTLSFCQPGIAEPITVINTNDSGDGSLRQAIGIATSADVITFELDFPATITLNSMLYIPYKGLTIQGPGEELLKVSGGGNCHHFHIYNTSEPVVISGLSIVSGDAGNGWGGGMYIESADNVTISDCTFSNNMGGAYGGAICNCAASPSIINCTFTGNSANHRGGGIMNFSSGYTVPSNPIVTNCTFRDNSASYHGGAICNSQSASPNFTNCTFYSNSAEYNGGGMYNNDEANPKVTNCIFNVNSSYRGGGMYSWDASPTVTNCTFSENSADYGGGINNSGSSNLQVTNCVFDNNDAVSGGGIYNNESSLNVSDCTFDTNSADYGGGIFNDFALTSSTLIQGNTFTGNIGVNKGGAIYNEYAQTVEIINCTLTGNSAEYGGGIYNYSSSPVIYNCTFTGNTANWGISMYSEEESEPVARNCIFWEDGGIEINSAFSSPDIAICVVENAVIGGYPIVSDIISADPILEPLADNGGPTWTCALSDESPAIDAGLTIAEISSDQRGAPRPYGESFDIGAYESGLGFYVITANWSDGGIISPDEAHALENGNEDEVFSIVPEEGYVIDEVLVDGFPESYDEGNNTYTFEAVSENHEIYASFVSTEEDDDDDSGDGCNISALQGTALLLVLPLMFILRKIK